MRKLSLIAVSLFFLLPSVVAVSSHSVQALTWYVDVDHCTDLETGNQDQPFCSIQSAIDEAIPKDTIQVAAGTYHEKITIKSGVLIQGAGQGLSIIDGGGSGTVVTASNVDSAAALDGFTITGGNGSDGGGMVNDQSSPTVSNCTFTGNSATNGGGMYNYRSFPKVFNCTFTNNSATNGGGMYNYQSSPEVFNCTFTGNSASWGGGMGNGYSSSPVVTNGIFLANSAADGGGMAVGAYSSPDVINCIFSGNSASSQGGGMDARGKTGADLINCTFTGNSASSGGGISTNVYTILDVTNCILWKNSPDEISNGGASVRVTYSNIFGGYTGTGNIQEHPMFVDAVNGDYHLQQDSLCIDAGDNSVAKLPATDLDGVDRRIDEPTKDDTGNGVSPIVDMGAYEYIDTDGDGTGDSADLDDDNDGVSDVTESAGPNSGDANDDGILDSLQNRVASIESYSGLGYVVLEAPAGTLLSDCEALDNPSPGDTPAGVSFPYGFFSFTISGITAGGDTTLTMTFPGGATPKTYYKHGMTPDNQLDHWYEFSYDEQTGVEINGNVIAFHFTDASRGDDTLIPDSKIIDVGGPGFARETSGGGGGGGCYIDILSYR